MRTGDNIRCRADGRYEARYIKGYDENKKIIWGYCYGNTKEEAENKRNIYIVDMVSPKKLNLLILGAGSHGQEVFEIADELRSYNKISFLDDDPLKEKLDYVIGNTSELGRYIDEYPVAFPAVGNKELRIKWYIQLSKEGYIIPTLIHKSANIMPSAVIEQGTVICAAATIGSGAHIGKGCIISNGATIGRNAVVEDWTYVDDGEIVHRIEK